MALRLDLYHEVHKQKQLERRDPLKLSLFGLAAVALCFAGYYGYQLNVQRELSNQLSSVKGEYNKIKTKAEAAKKREDELNQTVKASENLVKRIESRFYWAPILENVGSLIPREVQVTKLAGDVTGESLKRCNFTVEGISAGAEPRKVAENLRTAIADKLATKYKNVNATFKSLEDGREPAKLDGQQLATAAFSINVQLQIGEEPPPPPPAPKRAKKAAASEDDSKADTL